MSESRSLSHYASQITTFHVIDTSIHGISMEACVDHHTSQMKWDEVLGSEGSVHTSSKFPSPSTWLRWGIVGGAASRFQKSSSSKSLMIHEHIIFIGTQCVFFWNESDQKLGDPFRVGEAKKWSGKNLNLKKYHRWSLYLNIATFSTSPFFWRDKEWMNEKLFLSKEGCEKKARIQGRERGETIYAKLFHYFFCSFVFFSMKKEA